MFVSPVQTHSQNLYIFLEEFHYFNSTYKRNILKYKEKKKEIFSQNNRITEDLESSSDPIFREKGSLDLSSYNTWRL